jgi:hypothetical protein
VSDKPRPPTQQALLAAIDAKLAALLVLALDAYIRETGVAKPKDRSIDTMLADVGVSTPEIARLLGKTDRAVQMRIKEDRERRPSKGRSAAAPAAGE